MNQNECSETLCSVDNVLCCDMYLYLSCTDMCTREKKLEFPAPVIIHRDNGGRKLTARGETHITDNGAGDITCREEAPDTGIKEGR